MALILTKAGLAALAAAESSGTKVQATHMAVGDGNGSTPEHTSSSTALVNEVWRGELQSITVNEEGETEAGQQVVFEAHIPITTGGWYIRECALYAGTTLLAIGPHPTLYKPDPDDATKVEHVIKAPITFGNADTVSLVVDPTVVLASQEHVATRISEHNEAEDAHQDIRAAGDDHASDTDNPHEVTAAQAAAVPLAGQASLTGGYSMAPDDLGTDNDGTVQIALASRNHQKIAVDHASAVFADPSDLATWPGGEVRLWITMAEGAAFSGYGAHVHEQYGSFVEMAAGSVYLVHLLGQGDGELYAYIDEVV